MENKLEQTLSDLIIKKKEKFGNILQKPYKVGKLQSIVGTVIECIGIDATVGELFGIENIDGNVIKAEAIGIKDGKIAYLGDENEVTIIKKNEEINLERQTKEKIAVLICEKIVEEILT